MMQNNILCSISTRGRYDTTLPLALSSVINQTKKPDKLVIFDDNDQPEDLRDRQAYTYLFQMLDFYNIRWEVLYGERKGQHYNHQKANNMGYKWVWRLDDDNIADPNVLETLYNNTGDDIGSVGGSVIVPPNYTPVIASGKIEAITYEPNIQWGLVDRIYDVDHLHCSFLYRAGVADYNLGLSRVAHREETLFTYQLKQKGYKNLVVPDCITWHLKNKDGGIRSSDSRKEMYDRDEQIFRNIVSLDNKTIVILDCGMGDHIVFKHVLPDIQNPVVFSCYPDIVPGRSIAEAVQMLGDISQYNIYQKMDQWNWTDSLENAFRKLYI